MFFAGCSTQKVQKEPESRNEPQEENINDLLRAAQPEIIDYPITTESETPLTILMPNEIAYSPNENDVYGQISACTGIPVEFSFQPSSDYEIFIQTSVIYAQDMPDLIWGISDDLLQEIDFVDDILVELSTYIEKSAPNYLSWLKDDERLRLDAATNDHKIYSFHMISEQEYGLSAFGPIIRKDLLEQLEYDVPQTYDDWDTILHETYGQVSQPLVLPQEAIFTGNYLSSGFGISLAFDGYGNGFYVEDNEVKFGMMEDSFCDFVSLLDNWYKENIITTAFMDLPSIGDTEYLIKQANGESAIFFATYQQLMSAMDISEIQDYSIIPISDPLLSKDTKSHLGSEPAERTMQAGFSVSVQCTNISEAIRFIDYLYSDEGILLTNYGIEGESYILENDNPVYTDMDINHYTAFSLIGVMTSGYFEKKIDYQLRVCSETWRKQSDFSYMLPTGLSYDPDTKAELVSLLADVTTIAKTELLLLISGEKNISDITSIRNSLDSAGIHRCIKIIQESLDAYLNR
jgi:putative aldouronate transport system substrate-binding protein